MQDLPDQPLQYLEDELPDDTPKRNILPVIVGSIAVFAAVLALGAYMLFQFLISVPGNIHSNETFVVEPGSPTKLIVQNLKERGLIRSELATLLLLRLQFHNQSLKAGTYIFEAPLSTPAILQYLIAGEPKSDLLRLTFIEGESAVSYGRRAGDVIPDFDTAAFVDQALLYEGRLFPETYLVPKDFTADELLAELLKTFEKNTAALAPAIEASSLSLDEILILASIVEREANTEESMRLVAGILLNRLEIGMALQVDASMEYVLDKPLSELTASDLELDTPYNTYLYPGLPPTAIGNPGIQAIDAVLNPTPSTYFFYITGNDGNFYYAEDFDEHRQNIASYLR